jgi:hypothetical protein
MSWHFSRALVEEYSAENFSAGARSALLSTTSTPQAFCSKDRMTICSRLSRFGMTFAPLTDDLGAELLTWFLEGFRAKTSVRLRGRTPLALTEHALDYGERCGASLAKYDPASSSWKTRQHSLFEEGFESLERLPNSGIMLGGELWEDTTSELPIVEREFGYWPTPTASDAKAFRPKAETNAKSCEKDYQQRPAYLYALTFGTIPSSLMWDWLMGFPLGWTRLEPLAMPRFQRWLRSHGKHSGGQ